MFKNIATGVCFTAVLGVAAHATPLDDALNIQKTKNPIGTLLRNNHACSPITPPSLLLLTATQPGPAAPGNITIPTLAQDRTTFDLTGSGMMCPLPNVTETFPVRVNNLNSSITTSIAYKNNITASLKLTLGSWLKLVDFDASNIEEVGIWITTAESPAFNPDLNRSAATLKKDKFCSTTSKPKYAAKAKIIDRACVGNVTISLVSKKDMSLNAFDLQFANLTVGLKASWIRDVSGAASDCTVDASGISTGKQPAGAGGGEAAPTADKVATSDGTLVDITVGSIEAKFKEQIPNVVSKPTAAQVASVSKTAKKPADKPAGKPADKAAEKPAEKPGQPAAQDKVCARNVVYQTNGMLVLGVNLLDAKRFLDDN